MASHKLLNISNTVMVLWFSPTRCHFAQNRRKDSTFHWSRSYAGTVCTSCRSVANIKQIGYNQATMQTPMLLVPSCLRCQGGGVTAGSCGSSTDEITSQSQPPTQVLPAEPEITHWPDEGGISTPAPIQGDQEKWLFCRVIGILP